jgi:hypothetical protein
MVALIVEKPSASGWGSDNILESYNALKKISSRRKDVFLYEISSEHRFTKKVGSFFSHIPKQSRKIIGIWVGYVPKDYSYRSIQKILLRKNIFLINSILDHQEVMDFNLWYSKIEDLTLQSKVVSNEEKALSVAESLGYPVIVRSGVQAMKGKGIGTYVANNKEELSNIVSQYYKEHILNKLLIIRKHEEIVCLEEFGIRKEFRVFYMRGECLGITPYWKNQTYPYTEKDLNQINKLTEEVISRFSTPFMALDVAQLVNGNWIVVEVGDAQFSGICHMDPVAYWENVVDEADQDVYAYNTKNININ